MRLYLTHTGRMVLRQIPVSYLVPLTPRHVSVRYQPNKYHHLEFRIDGTVWVNDWPLGIDADLFNEGQAIAWARQSKSEIVGLIAVQLEGIGG